LLFAGYSLDSKICNSINIDGYINNITSEDTIIIDDHSLWDFVLDSVNAEIITKIEDKIRMKKRISWKVDKPLRLAYNLSKQYFLLNYLILYKKTEDILHLTTAKTIIYDWIKSTKSLNNFDYFTNKLLKKLISNPPLMWNDDCASNRIIYQTMVFKSIEEKNLINSYEYNVFLKNVIRHGLLIANEKYYNSRTNHGLMENRALLFIALSFPEIKMRKQWIKFAVERMEDQIRENVTDDGIHKEFSSFYHYYALKEFCWFFIVCKMNGLKLTTEYETKLKLMIKYLNNILLPDASLPLMGDTFKTYIDLGKWPLEHLPKWKEFQELLFTLNNPKNNIETFKEYKHAGIVTYKSYEPGCNCFLLFNASPNRKAHNHYDALSFIYFKNNRIFTGPGYPEYNNNNRTNLISASSQNTVSVNDMNYKPGDAKLLFSDFDSNNKLIIVCGEHSLYDNIYIKRCIIHLREKLILIIDEIQGEGKHQFTQNFRIDENLNYCSNYKNELASIYFPKNQITMKSLVIKNDMILFPKVNLNSKFNFSFYYRGSYLFFITLINNDITQEYEIIKTLDGIMLYSNVLGLTVQLPIVVKESIKLKS